MVILQKHERRKLEEIENQLNEDTEFVRSMGGTNLTWLPSKISPSMALGIFSVILAVLCLFLGEGSGFLTASALAGLLITSPLWHVQT